MQPPSQPPPMFDGGPEHVQHPSQHPGPHPGQHPGHAHGQPPYGYGPPRPPPQKSSSALIVLVVIVAMGVPILGVLAALAIYGTRRYLQSAKSAEGKNTIAAISRSAVTAYEVSGSGLTDGKLCRSASPVPAKVPAGTKYMPVMSGGDFDTGDASTGWKCLKFSKSTPMYYQYRYDEGGGYAAPASAPAGAGFQAAAIGDLDADGSFSTFAQSGALDPTLGRLTLGTQLHIQNEFE